LTAYTNQLRRAFKQDVADTLDWLTAARTNRDAVELLYRFLLNAGVEQQLRHWRDQAIQQGKLDQARNHEQAWQALMDLLDEYATIYGEEPFDFALFEDVLLTGLENVTFG
ncbi:hypothetical protein, partial [Enterococcus sp.]